MLSKKYFVTIKDKLLVKRYLKRFYKKNLNELCISEIPYNKLSNEAKQNIANYYGVQQSDMEFPCADRKISVSWYRYGIDITLKENGVIARQGVTIIPENDKFLYRIYTKYLYESDRWHYVHGI